MHAEPCPEKQVGYPRLWEALRAAICVLSKQEEGRLRVPHQSPDWQQDDLSGLPCFAGNQKTKGGASVGSSSRCRQPELAGKRPRYSSLRLAAARRNHGHHLAPGLCRPAAPQEGAHLPPAALGCRSHCPLGAARPHPDPSHSHLASFQKRGLCRGHGGEQGAG